MWIGRQKRIILDEHFAIDMLFPLGMYAWHASDDQDRQLAARQLVHTTWKPELSLQTTLVDARHWLNRVKLHVYFEGDPITDSWVAEGKVNGFDFCHLGDFAQVMEEKLAMRNCLDSYADRLAGGKSRLFGMRHQGRRIATLEIAPDGGPNGLPRIVQLKGPANAPPTLDVCHAASTWIGQHTRKVNPGLPRAVGGEPYQTRLHALLNPYWSAVCCDRSIEAASADVTIRKLDEALNGLARLAGVGGWLFPTVPRRQP